MGNSGDVCSEGRSLTKEDEKTYWGKISWEGEETTKEPSSKQDDATNSNNDSSTVEIEPRLFVKGSVLYGYGLEPQPVGRFVMTETESHTHDDDEDEGIDSDDDVDDASDTDPFSDWSNAFQ